MLIHLSIRDFAIVDTLELDFAAGFTSLTGETGAGKSILLDALALTLGDRADADVVRAGAERAEVVAEFSIPKAGPIVELLADSALEGDAGQLILRRLLERSGRSRAFINGRPATLTQLREVGESLVDIHGQHAHQSLTRADTQRDIVDRHGKLDAQVAEVANAHRSWQQARRARDEYQTHAAARDAERDQLAWRVEELRRVAPQAGEWEALRDEHSRLAHAASLVDGTQTALDALSEADSSVVEVVGGIATRLRALVAYDVRLDEVVAALEAGQSQLQDVASALRHYCERVDIDPARLAIVNDRIEALHSTARKLRSRPEELPRLLEEAQVRLDAIEQSSNLDALERVEDEAGKRYARAAAALTKERKRVAATLAKQVAAVMKDLALGVAKFEIAFPPIEGGSAGGDERAEFLIATNAGTEPRPIAKIASGGELSRIGLAIQVVASKASTVPTLIFDEVDAGIGGAVAEIVGRRLGALGAERQVLCVTHLPQVAARANQQWSVAKTELKGQTRSRVTVLDEQGRTEEIARMLGGTEITALTRRHAAEMLGFKGVK